ncbi:MAG TPA: slipin family protein [Chloroflexota bacterium]|jgi:regulator of protease activity HflC (stomatin/prohibitin superfamily)|nr:slipin family protein [Chloroflexota bacterium]
MNVGTIGAIIIGIIIVVTILASLRICSEWERKVVLRLGRFSGVRGPGIFFLLPYIEQTPFTMDMRVVTSQFSAESTLTKDGASVAVDSILYWRIVDAGLAAVRVANYSAAVMGAAQGALRDIIGRNDLSTLLSQRRELDEQLTVILDEQTEPWGIKVQSVQLRDIKVPDNLQDALSRMAQAERERQARVILGESEVQVAQQFSQAGELYRMHPTALHLRGMNMLYETMRSGVASVIVVPASALDSMNLGAVGGIAALRQMAPDGQPPASESGQTPPPPPPTTTV